MKMNWKVLTFISAFALGAAVLSGCGPKGGLELTVSAAADQGPWLKDILDKFNEGRDAKDKVDFKIVAHGEDAVDSEVTDWEAGPDVYAFASDKIVNLYKAGAMAALPKDTQDWIKAEMGEEALKSTFYANKYVAYPYQDDNGYFLYYDSDKLTAEDVDTMDNLLAKCETLDMKISYPVKSTTFYSLGLFFTFGCGWTMDVDPTTGAINSVTANFNTDKGVAAARVLYHLLHSPYWQDTQVEPGTEGVVATVNGTWADYRGASIKCTRLPKVSAEVNGTFYGLQPLGSFLGYKMLGVNPMRSGGNVERLALAHEVAKYLSSKDVQQSRFKAFGYGPSNLELKNDPDVKANKKLAAINEQKPYSTPQTAVPTTLWNAPNEIVAHLEDAATEPSYAEYMAYLQSMNDAIENLS